MFKVQHFEIPADDLARAKKFYSEVFKWKLRDFPGMSDYAMAYTVDIDEKNMPKEVGAINGGITKRENIAPDTRIYITVESLDKSMEAVRKAGGTILSQPKEVPNMGKYAFARDTEGNVIGIWETTRTE